jgi:hypothetical protein
VKISHVTLLDVTMMDRALPFDCTALALPRCLPGTFVYHPTANATLQKVGINVAPIALLVEQLKTSLDANVPWRMQRDRVRLRALSHAIWIKRHTHLHRNRGLDTLQPETKVRHPSNTLPTQFPCSAQKYNRLQKLRLVGVLDCMHC